MSGRASHSYLVAIIAVGAALRFYQLDKLSLSHVEAMSFWFSRHTLEELLTYIPILEVIPPLYSITLKAWGPFGDTEAALRSLSAVVSTLTIPLVYFLGRTMARPADATWVGLSAAALFALSPFQLQFAQESRYPACLTFAVTLALTGMAWLVRNPRRACRPWLGLAGSSAVPAEPSDLPAGFAWLTAIVGTALSLWLHTTPVFFVGAVGVAALFWAGFELDWDRRLLLNLLLAGVVAFLLWAPFLPTLLRIMGNVSENWWMSAPGLFEIAVNVDLLFGVAHLHYAYSFLFVLTGLVGFLLIGRRSGWSAAVLLASVAGLPVLFAILVSHLLVPVFLYRTLIWVTVPYYVMIAAGTTAFDAPWLRVACLSALAGAFAVGSINYHQLHEKQPWRKIAASIADDARPDDLVLVMPNAIEVAFDYYAERRNLQASVLVLPASFPAINSTDHPYPTDITSGPGMIPADLPELRNRLGRHRDVWLVTWLEEAFDPRSLVRNLLRETHELVEESEVYEDIVLARFERRRPLSGD